MSGDAEDYGDLDVRRNRRIRVVAWTVIIGALVAAPVTLWCQYSYPTPASMEARPARNYLGSRYLQ